MRPFYHFVMRYRGMKRPTNESRLADWIFYDHDFPKQSTSYHEISSYLEWNIPFTDAVQVFDMLWEEYLVSEG